MLKLTATKQAQLGIFRKLHAVKLTVLLSSLFVSKWQITGCTLFVITAVQMHSHFTPCCTLCSPFTKSWSRLQLESSHNNLMAGKMKTCRQKLFVRLRLQTLNKRVTKKKVTDMFYWTIQSSSESTKWIRIISVLEKIYAKLAFLPQLSIQC